MKSQRRYGFWYGFNITALLLSVFFLFLVPILQAFEQLAQNVDMHLNQIKVTQVGEKAEVQVHIINASSTPLNAIEFEIIYDKEALFIHDITPTGTLCEERFILTNRINNASGTAQLQCGTITPFTLTSGIVATLHITPLQSGTSSISFGTTSTHVLMHDGLGTDATRSRTSLVFITL